MGAPKELGAVGGGLVDWKLRRADILVKEGPLRLIAGEDATAETEDMVGGAFDERGRDRKRGVDASCSKLCASFSCCVDGMCSLVLEGSWLSAFGGLSDLGGSREGSGSRLAFMAAIELRLVLSGECELLLSSHSSSESEFPSSNPTVFLRSPVNPAGGRPDMFDFFPRAIVPFRLNAGVDKFFFIEVFEVWPVRDPVEPFRRTWV